MYNFTFHAPTTIHFGKGQISHLADLAGYGKKVLLCYGGGSIKRNGIYDQATKILSDAGLQIFELSGVEPNPRIQTVRRGVDLCRKESIDMVLAIGGGSTIDCAKVVAAGAKYDGDAWDLVIHPELIKAALPIFSVLTLAATGSEMDAFAVISDMTKNEKWGTAAECLKPTMSVLDPTYTFSVPARQTAAGTADMMSHTFENYFSMDDGAYVQKRMAEALLKTMIHYGPIALEKPDDYDARANLMWAASHAINGLVGEGCAPAWCVHPMEHELSAFYDITHGEGLAILTPAWMEHVLSEKTEKQFATYGRNVWGLTGTDDAPVAREAIARTRQFFTETMHMPATLHEVGITDEEHFDVMAQKAADGSKGSFVPLTKEDIVEIYRAAK
ncbi:MAG: iron-containing alcohol dehydrogenase [Coriobacteriaceae bacterium]|jgi:alcohol dehydrogenase YqhD (iron-dependent ADH family)|nr:iron-containing alcohol dehydrogenase [Olsenella sp.]MDY5003375.1 iron-containing alcohol dehydrogenase [Atopobiaceae bacterium]RRF93495.1 MAG: iron-containing alcohol dehydrogenase [Coriobacteriaceae bacterium]